jgi:hypothetical protein
MLGSKVIVQNHLHETSSYTRSRIKNEPIGAEFSTANDASIYPNFTKRKSGSRIRTFNGGISAGQGSCYPLSSIETTVHAYHNQSSSAERIMEQQVSWNNEDGRNPFSEELKPGEISKTVEFETHESIVEDV